MRHGQIIRKAEPMNVNCFMCILSFKTLLTERLFVHGIVGYKNGCDFLPSLLRSPINGNDVFQFPGG